jgi:hypothetical protein
VRLHACRFDALVILELDPALREKPEEVGILDRAEGLAGLLEEPLHKLVTADFELLRHIKYS